MTLPHKPQTVFISSSRDMTAWAALTSAYVRDFATRHGLSDLAILDYRDIDPADVDHAISWQDNVGAPSGLDTALTVVLLGERLGTPLPATFRLKHDIHARLQRDGHQWVHVAGITPGPVLPDQVPLTGVLFEYFDAFLPRANSSKPGPLRVIFKGTFDGPGEPDFGNGDFRAQIEATDETAQRKRQLRKEYDQQLDWMNFFWGKLYGLQQHANLFCPDQTSLIEQLERTLSSIFLARGPDSSARPRRAVDPEKVELPGPTPYDLERAALFLGRGPQIAELSRRALQSETPRRLVPVIGESGTGKSSLLRAGLMNDARSPARQRLGWRTALVPLADRAIDEPPLAFLAKALTDHSVLPELGSADVLCQRLQGVAPIESAGRLLDTLADLELAHPPGLGRPKLLLIVDQLELALDSVRLERPEVASEWTAFLQILAALGDALLDPAMRQALGLRAVNIATKLPCTVVVALPADRFKALAAIMQPGDQVFPVPRLVDETALREVITGTFAALGLSIAADAREALCEEAIRLAVGTESSVLPLLSVALSALHVEWKDRRRIETKWRERAGSEAEVPLGLRLIGVKPACSSASDVSIDDVKRAGRLDQAIERLGELAWNAAEKNEFGIKTLIRGLPISAPRQRAESGEVTGRDFALARLLRRLVAVSADESVPDRLTGLPDPELEEVARPIAEALRTHRLLTLHNDGTWWLVHIAVLRSWRRAAEWRTAEVQTFRTIAAMQMDQIRWHEETTAGEPDASRWLWTREREVERAREWLMSRGTDENPNLAAFVKESMIAAARHNASLIGPVLLTATYFNDGAWCESILAGIEAKFASEVNYINCDGSRSPLGNACWSGNAQLVKRLLHAGACATQGFADGSMPLSRAASVGADESCEILIAAGAPVDHSNNRGWTALMAASENGHDAVVARLLAAGGEVNQASDQGYTALIMAAQTGRVSVVNRLIASGAEINSETSDGSTALTHAAANGHEEVVACLLAAGADIHHLTANGGSALSVAAQNGYDVVVALLATKGADVDHLDGQGMRPLTLAAKNGFYKVVACLLAAGARVEVSIHNEDRVGVPARPDALPRTEQNALSTTSGTTVGLIGGKVCLVHDAPFKARPYRVVYHIDKKQLELIFKSGPANVIDWAPIDELNDHFRNIGKILVVRRHYGTPVEVYDVPLWKLRTGKVVGNSQGHSEPRGAAVSFNSDDSGLSALILASKFGHREVVSQLLNAGAAINATDPTGTTALLAAIKCGHDLIAEELLDAGCDGDLSDDVGNTPLMEAVRLKEEKVVQALLDYGVDPSKRNKDDLSALDIAYVQDAKSIVDLLLAAGLPPLSKHEFERLPKTVGMTIGLVVNARGKLCLVHDNRFKGTPILVGYHVDKRRLEIFFDTGDTFPIDWVAINEMNNFLLKFDRILMILMRYKRPIEGFDISFVHVREGEPIAD